MPETTSPEQPQTLRWLANAMDGWISRLSALWVEGQLIQISRRSGSATVFLTLRDRLGEVSVSVTIAPATLDAAGPPPEGSAVVAHLRPRYYRPTGRLSFHCDDLRIVGEGMLLARLEQTKRMLQAEGLFDPRRKQRLPFLPGVIGLVTAPGSAAERDVCENVARRWPAAVIRTAAAVVQGPQAVEQLITALRRLDNDPAVEVIVVARGGGSLEDLLPFSNESLVRAVAACRTPVVSAIGHEVDSPILDLVADARASTPTDAAKLVVPEAANELRTLDQVRDRLRRAIGHRLQREEEALAGLRSRPVLQAPTATVAVHAEQVAQLRSRLQRAVEHRIATDDAAIHHLLARCRAMSPKATLERGYVLAIAPDGHALTSTGQVVPGDDVRLYLADGQLTATVTSEEPAA